MILTGGRRRVQRQQTLQAAMDWSWDLLDERDQTVLRRLSVFQGGCTLEAAEDVCGAELDAVAGLRALVAKSLVVAEERAGTVRYRLLETVRLYAEDKLAASGEGEEVRERHRDHYLAWAEAFPLEDIVFGMASSASDSALEREEENIRAALRWSEAHERFDLVARMLCATRRLWILRHRDAPTIFRRALAADLAPELRGPLLAAVVSLPGVLTNRFFERPEQATEAIALMEGEASPWLFAMLRADVLNEGLQAVIARDQERADEALALADRLIALGRSIGDFWEGMGYDARGDVLLMQLRHREALDCYTECAARSGRTGASLSRSSLSSRWLFCDTSSRTRGLPSTSPRS